MPKLKPEELQARRQDIIEAARACFLRSGFHQTTTDEICREASITPGGLYHYFASKDDLIAAVITQSTEQVVTRLSELIETPEDVRSAFQQVAFFFFETLRDPELDNITRLDIEVFAEALKNPRLAEISRRSWAMRRERLETLISRGVEAGLYRADDVDARGLSSLLIAILVGLRLGKLLWKDDFDTGGAVRSLFLMHAGRLVADTDRFPIPAA